jgi:hypothetical protein
MHNRTAKLLSAAGAGVIAGLAVAVVPLTTAAADECLSAPNAPTPAGSHWYYRTDHVNKRKCWYVRKVDTASKAALPTDSAAAAPTDTDPPAAATTSAKVPSVPAKLATTRPLTGAVADARAEYVAPTDPAPLRSAVTPAPTAPSPFPAPSAAMIAAPPSEASPATTEAPPADSATMDQRWSDAAASPPPATAEATTKLLKAAQSAAKAGTANASGSMTSGTIATLLGALLAALAIAGGIVGAVCKFAGREPIVRRDPDLRADRWEALPLPDMVAHDFTPTPIDLDAEFGASRSVPASEPPSWIKAARERQVANDAGQRPAPREATDEIEQLLSLAQKRSAA